MSNTGVDLLNSFVAAFQGYDVILRSDVGDQKRFVYYRILGYVQKDKDSISANRVTPCE